MRFIALTVLLALAAGLDSASATTLDAVKDRNVLRCGVHPGLPGFASKTKEGQWSGFDIDYCRALAAAVLGDASKVEYLSLEPNERFVALEEDQIDVLSRNTTWTMGRDTTLDLHFAGISYYDGQGFMVKRSMGITSALELTGAAICVQSETTHELNLEDFFKANNMSYRPVVFENLEKVKVAYSEGLCNAYTTDASGLYAVRLEQANPSEHIVLREIISKEPLGPVVREGDDQWFDIARWVLFAQINAEELGVTSKNAAEARDSRDQSVRRLLGREGTFGEALGLSNDWAFNIISQVGNYGEVFERNIGVGSPLGIARGLNALWSKGGLQYAPPIR